MPQPPWGPAPYAEGETPPRWRWQGRRMRRGLFWRFGCMFLLFGLLAVLGASTLVSLTVRVASGGALAISPETVLAIAVLLAGSVMAANMFRRVASPLADLMEAAGRVAEGDYAARVPPGGFREMRGLVRAFNTMAERLQVNDEQRRALMADIAHELRTPLSVVQGQIEGLLDGVYPRDDAHLTLALEETRVLARLVEDLRTLALSESGALHLQPEPVEIGALAHEAAAAFRAQADATGVALNVRAEGLPAVEADPVRLREVLANLLANALRYTPRGGTVEVRGRVADGQIEITVSDTGTGIPPEDLPHVFDRFHKSHDSGGSGLGLTIAKNLVVAHGGTIRAESALGKGTTITVMLPLRAGDE